MSRAATLFPDEFYRDADLRLVQALQAIQATPSAPSAALNVLDVDSPSSALAEVLRHIFPACQVMGFAEAHASTPEHYTQLLPGDFSEAVRRIPPASLDAIIIGERTLTDPARLATLHALLRPQGKLLAAVHNAQHWSQFERLLRGEPALGLTAPQCVRALLDAGFLPHFADRRIQPLPDTWLATLPPLAEHLRLGLPACLARSQTLTYVITARPLPEITAGIVPPVTLGVCTNDADVLADNLLASPDLEDDTHEVIAVKGAKSLAEGLETVLAQASHELVVVVHQDIYLPRGWFARLWSQYALAQEMTGERVGVMGVYGVHGGPQGILRAGRVADRDALLDETASLPAPVSSLDEIVLAMPRQTPLRADPALGFHLYGTDLALAAEQAGLSALVIDAPCHHNSQQSDELPAVFHASAEVLRGRWPERLPLATPCMLLR